MAIPKNVIIAYNGTHASIPDGFVRETNLDARYPKSVSSITTSPGGSGGASTHTHSGTAGHTHTAVSHTHTVTIAANNGGSIGTGGGGGNASRNDHNHGSPFTSNGSTGGGLTSQTATYGAVSNDPPYYQTIFIKSLGTHEMPDDAMVFFDDSVKATGLSGIYICDGANGTPSLNNKFIKGANTSANAGATGGSTTNVHALQHTHGVSLHSHSTKTTAHSVSDVDNDEDNPKEIVGGHTHSFGMSGYDSISSSYPNVTTSETVQPPYNMLTAYMNTSGASKQLPKGSICLWLGTPQTIPAGYRIKTEMLSRYLKITTSWGSVNSKSGSTTHSHTSDVHNHTSTGHGHSGTQGHNLTVDNNNSSGGQGATGGYHNWSANSRTVTYNGQYTSAQSSANEPLYRNVLFIEKIAEAGGSFLLNLV